MCNFYAVFIKLADKQDRLGHIALFTRPGLLAHWVSSELSLPIGLYVIEPHFPLLSFFKHYLWVVGLGDGAG